MKERFNRFMIGRNGNDQLNLFLLISALVLLFAGTFFGGLFRAVFRTLAIALIVLVYIRMFSKDVYKRQEENTRYLNARYRLFAKLKAVLRVPKGRGKIKIMCRKCGNSFIGKS